MTRTWDDIARRADGVTVETPEGRMVISVRNIAGERRAFLATSGGCVAGHEASLIAVGAELADARAAHRTLLERVAIAAGLTDAVGCDEETVLAALQQTWLRAGELAAKAALLDEWREAWAELKRLGLTAKTKPELKALDVASDHVCDVERRMREWTEASHG